MVVKYLSISKSKVQEFQQVSSNRGRTLKLGFTVHGTKPITETRNPGRLQMEGRDLHNVQQVIIGKYPVSFGDRDEND